jgi:hypothetical protein
VHADLRTVLSSARVHRDGLFIGLPRTLRRARARLAHALARWRSCGTFALEGLDPGDGGGFDMLERQPLLQPDWAISRGTWIGAPGVAHSFP